MGGRAPRAHFASYLVSRVRECWQESQQGLLGLRLGRAELPL